MHSVAAGAALPPPLVELRHECVHRALPSAARLRRAAADCLRWLWSWYWGKLDALVADAAGVAAAAAPAPGLRPVLKAYLGGRRAEVKRGVEESEAARGAAGEVGALLGAAGRMCETLSRHLVDGRVLIPSERR